MASPRGLTLAAAALPLAVLLWAAPALANTATSTYGGWNAAGWTEFNQCTDRVSFDDYWGGELYGGSPGPAFGLAATPCGAPGKQQTVWQYAGAEQVAASAIPGGATLLGATLRGQLADSAVNGFGLVAGERSVELCQTMVAAGGQYFCGPATTVAVDLPGVAGQPAGFAADVYDYVASAAGGAPFTDLFAGPSGRGGGFLAPLDTWTLSLQYAFTPTGITVGGVATGSGTQASITWNTNGNDSTVPYVLQREVLQGGSPVQGWTTIYRGTAPSFVTSDQGCGLAYVYRVAAVGPHAATPWDESAEWDGFPCTVRLAGATATSLTLSWPQVSPDAVPVVVWCLEGTPAGGVSCQQTSVTLAPGVSSATITGLQPNSEYAVWACTQTDSWGCPEQNVWTYAAAPLLRPENTVTSAGGVWTPPYDDQALSWTAAGNPPGTVYRLRQAVYAPSGQATDAWIDAGTGDAALATQAAAGSYAYWAYAVNAGYGGSLSPASDAVVTQVASTPTLQAAGPTAATLSWSPVYGMAVTGVDCQLPEGAPPLHVADVAAGGTTYELTGLQPGGAYACAIYAEASNQGIPWRQGSATVWTPPDPPGQPTLDGVAQRSVTVDWTTGGDAAGTEYRAQLVPCASPDTPAAASGWIGDTRWTATGLQPGTCYRAAVVARNGAGVVSAAAWSAAVPTVPAAPSVLEGTSGGLGWAASGGRGYVTLSWPAVPGAAGYRVWVWDGAAYEAFDAGASTTWDSRSARPYPPDASLYPNVALGSKSPPVLVQDGGGLDLRDRPLDLYCTTGPRYCTQAPAENYWFTVSAYNASGDSATYQVPGSTAPAGDYYEPTLPLQTDPAAPTLSGVSAGNADGYAYGPHVQVNLAASESPSGIAAYALSNDGATWTAAAVAGCRVGQVAACPTSLQVSVPWTLTPGPGTKTVYAKVESTAGVWSAVAAATVYVEADQQAPTVDVSIDSGAPSTASTAVTVATTVTDPVAVQAGLTFRARYSTDGGQSWTAWVEEGAVTRWTAAVTLPGGAPGERTVLEQVEDSDLNLGQGGATIDYGPQGTGAAPGPVAGAAARSCRWPVDGRSVPATCITEPQVNLALAPPAGAVRMRASLDGVSWGDWQPAATGLAVNLGSAPGLKTVWVEYQDGQGNVRPDPAADPAYYVLDPGPPVARASWLGGAAATGSSGDATLQLQVTDPVGTAGVTVVVTENGSPLYAGPLEDSLPLVLGGTGYQVVQVAVTDISGNETTLQLGIFVQ